VHRPSRVLPLLTAILVVVAVPVLAREPEPTFLKKSLTDWFTDLHHPKDAAVRRSAAFALGKIGPPAAGAVPRLVEELNDPDTAVREASAFALGEIGPTSYNPQAIPVLLQTLQSDKDAKVRRSAAYALGRYGPHASQGAAALQNALGDAEPVVRANAAWALGQLGKAGGGNAISGLMQVLDSDTDTLVRRDAAQALGVIGRDAHVAVPALLKRFRGDPDAVVKKAALDALVNTITQDDKDALPDLLQALHNPDADVAKSAALALANLGGAGAKEAVPFLIKALKDDDDPTRRLAAAALANIGEYAVRALPDLTAALGDRDADVRRLAALALGRMGPLAKSAVPELIKALAASEPEEVRKYAAEALSNIDPNDADAVAALIRMLGEDPSWRVRHRVVWALEKVKNFEQEELLKAMASNLGDEAQETRLLRYEAAKALALRLGPRIPDKVLDVLLEALRDTNVKIYTGTGSKVTGGGEARTGETQVKETGEGDWRRIVAIALARVGKRAAARADIMEALEKLANDSFDPTAKAAATNALTVLKKM
jgi:HEAT repeat protein